MLQLLWKTVWWFLKKLKLELPHDPAVPPLSIHPERVERGSRRDICTPLFTAAGFATANGGSDLRVHGWMMDKYRGPIHTLGYLSLSLLSRKEILTHAATWMDLEDTMLSEISQSQKDKPCVIPLI